MLRRILCVLLVLSCVVVLGGPVLAGEITGSIRVTLHNGESVVSDGAVSLYRVAVPMAFDYRLVEDFGGGIVKGEDALSPHLARWLAEMADEDRGIQRLLDADGSGEFTDLPEGLYLLVQTERSTGFHRMEPMLVELPCQGQWHVQAYPLAEDIIQEIVPEVPATGQSPAPLLGAVGMVVSGTGLAFCARRRRKV